MLLVLEHHFYKTSDNKVWCDRIINYEYFKRYLNVFEEITVLARLKEVDSVEEGYLLASGPNVIFIGLSDCKGLKQILINLPKWKKNMHYALEKSDACILRMPSPISIYFYYTTYKIKKIKCLEMVMSATRNDGNINLLNKFINHIVENQVKKYCLDANGVSYVTKDFLQNIYPCTALKDKTNKKYFTESYVDFNMPISKYYDSSTNKNAEPVEFKIIHTGYMENYRKGQDTLMKVGKSLIEKGYKVKLIFIGDGGKLEELKDMAKGFHIDSKVDFRGAINNKDEILKILRNAHIFVMPTHLEGLPRSILEAMSQGLPCVASPVDGIPELLPEQFLVDYDDVDGYVNLIEKLLNDWDGMKKAGHLNYLKSLNYCYEKQQVRENSFYQKIYQRYREE